MKMLNPTPSAMLGGHPSQLEEFPQSFRDLRQIRTPRFNTEKNFRHIQFETQLGGFIEDNLIQFLDIRVRRKSGN